QLPFHFSQNSIIPVSASPSSIHLEVGLASKPLVLNDLDPVSIRIQQESHILHPPVGKPLLPAALQVLEALARRVKVIHRDTCSPVSKSPETPHSNHTLGREHCGVEKGVDVQR